MGGRARTRLAGRIPRAGAFGLRDGVRVAELCCAPAGSGAMCSAAGVVDVLERIARALPAATPPVRNLLAQRLRQPSGITWAPVGGGFALPHPSARDLAGTRRRHGRADLPARPAAADRVPSWMTCRSHGCSSSSRRRRARTSTCSVGLGRFLSTGPLRELALAGASDDEIFDAVDRPRGRNHATGRSRTRDRRTSVGAGGGCTGVEPSVSGSRSSRWWLALTLAGARPALAHPCWCCLGGATGSGAGRCW